MRTPFFSLEGQARLAFQPGLTGCASRLSLFQASNRTFASAPPKRVTAEIPVSPPLIPSPMTRPTPARSQEHIGIIKHQHPGNHTKHHKSMFASGGWKVGNPRTVPRATVKSPCRAPCRSFGTRNPRRTPTKPRRAQTPNTQSLVYTLNPKP